MEPEIFWEKTITLFVYGSTVKEVRQILVDHLGFCDLLKRYRVGDEEGTLDSSLVTHREDDEKIVDVEVNDFDDGVIHVMLQNPTYSIKAWCDLLWDTFANNTNYALDLDVYIDTDEYVRERPAVTAA